MRFNKYSTIKAPKHTSQTVVPHDPDRDQMLEIRLIQLKSDQGNLSQFKSELSDGTKQEPPNLELNSPQLTMRRVSLENSKYSVHYYVSQAITGLVINISQLILGPFAILLLRLIYGKYLMHSMFIEFSKSYAMNDFLSWVWVLSTLTFIFVHPELNIQMAIIYLATGSVIFLRQIMVSLKYGYYTKNKWNKMKDSLLTDDEIMSGFLLQVWVKVPEAIAEKEIISSLKRQKVEPSLLELKFSYYPDDCRPIVSTGNLNSDQPYEGTCPVIDNRINILPLAKYLIKQVTTHQNTQEIYIITVFGYLYVASFIILRFYGFGIHGFRADPFEILYTSFSAYKAYIASTHFVKFISAGLYDYKRKMLLMSQCSGLISRVDRSLLLFYGSSTPMLDLEDPSTILAWYYLRRTFIDFGKRYTLRVFTYASLVLPICVSVIIILLLQLFGVIGVSYNYYLVPSLMLTIEVFGFILYMTFTALKLNRTFSIHRDLLLEIFIKAKYTGPDKFLALRNLSYVIERLKHDQSLRPVKILGIAINDSLMIQMIVLAISGVFAIIRLAA